MKAALLLTALAMSVFLASGPVWSAQAEQHLAQPKSAKAKPGQVKSDPAKPAQAKAGPVEPAQAQAGQGEPAQAAPGEAVPTKITSERMFYNHLAQTLTFEGSVLVDRPDFTIRSKKLVVHFTPAAAKELNKQSEPKQSEPEAAKAKGQPSSDAIDHMEAIGSVLMQKDGRTGKCETAVYDVRQEVLTMRGDPVLNEGANQIQGEVIRFNMKDNTSEVLGGKSGRVEALFFSSPKSIKPGK